MSRDILLAEETLGMVASVGPAFVVAKFKELRFRSGPSEPGAMSVKVDVEQKLSSSKNAPPRFGHNVKNEPGDGGICAH
jgi:hypothetical protein